MDSSAEQTFMRTGRNSGWRPVRLRPVRVSFRCPSGARPLALALGWWWLGFTWAEHAAHDHTPGSETDGRHTQGGAPLTACYSPSRDRAERAYVPPYGGTTVQSADRSASATRAQPAELRASAASRGCYNPRRSAARPARVGRVDRAPPALAGCGVVYHRPVRSARLAHDSW